jgi:acetyltransferase-like isoleucine patch superfamily enzyme
MGMRNFLWKRLTKRRYLMAHFFWPHYYRFFIGSMGKGCIIERADTIANPERIFIGSGVRIGHSARIEAISTFAGVTYNSKIIIGDGTVILPYVHIGAARFISIGDNVLMASRVFITDHDHSYDNSEIHVGLQPLTVSPVTIGDFVWLGENVVVCKGVTIGRNAIVGANSVVTTNIPPFATAVGAPARSIKIREHRS